MNIQNSPNINYLWAALIVEELIRNGIDYFCISPGSRSAPLTLAVAANKKAKTFVHFDERGTAFHALGYISATKKPCVLVCTSGTAAANFFPAIIEASKKKLPLIVLTADRPPELRHTGANQTIDQVKIFGDYVRWFFDLPCPTMEIKPEFILTTIDQAIFRSQGELKGPVHINCMFREPLSLQKEELDKKYLQSLEPWLKSAQPATSYEKTSCILSALQTAKVIKELSVVKTGIIAVGKLASFEEQQSVIKLAKRLNWPIFADITSGMRLGNREGMVVHYFDQILHHKIKPIDCLIQLGGRITSKRFDSFLKYQNLKSYIMVLNHPLRNDPGHVVTTRIQAPIGLWCETLCEKIPPKKDLTLLNECQNLNLHVNRILEEILKEENTLSEAVIARLISQNIPKDDGLFLSNSLPIREMDMFADPFHNHVTVGANRGASGIDGIIATAIGFSHGLDKRVTAMIGDLAFLYDINSLAMLDQVKGPVVFVVLNNDGGGIFSFLPIAEDNPYFKKFWMTPHGYSFEHISRQFKLNYTTPKSTKEFIIAYQKALKDKVSSIIEIKTDAAYNLKIHQVIAKKISTLSLA